jgi:hypothetical protein
MDHLLPAPLPLIPEALRRRHHVHEPKDGRFRAAARLQQALWRDRIGLEMGSYVGHGGRRRKLGSRLDNFGIENGLNIVDDQVRRLTRREIWYRERGAAMDEHRVWSNLLSSMPLAFNVFGMLKTNRQLAQETLSYLFPDIRGTISHIAFEHSPGRGDECFIGDGSAFDVFISIRHEDGRKIFLGIEVKFSETLTEPAARHRELYDIVSRDSGLYLNPDAPELRNTPLEQMWRMHMLSQQLIRNGLYDDGYFILCAPSLNDDVQGAAKRYRSHLGVGEHLAGFVNLTLEHLIETMREAGADTSALEDRYCDWGPVHRALDMFLEDQHAKSV